MGLTFAPLSATVMAAVSGNRQGQASGSYNAIRELGGVFGIAILGAVFQHVATSPSQFVTGFHVAIFAGAAVVAVGAVSALFLPVLEKSRASEPRMQSPRVPDRRRLAPEFVRAGDGQ